MKAFFAFFLFLLLVTSASAMNCTLSEDEELCFEIQHSRLSNSEKNYLYEAIGKSYELPVHESYFLPVENIELQTNKLTYNGGELIKVHIIPSNQDFKLEYADQTYNVKGYFETEAIYPYNKVSIEHNGRIYEAVFHVKDNSAFYLLFPLSIFVGLNYVIVALVKKYWGVLV